MTVLPPTHNETQALLSWLLGRREGVVKPDPLDGSIKLSFGRLYQVTVAAIFALATVMWAFVVVVFSGERGTAIALAIGFGFLWVAALYGLYDAFWVVVKASSRGLESISRLFGARMLPWEDIQSVRYATYGNWYTFRSGQGWAIRISIYRNGLRSFASLVSSNIGRSPARFTPPTFYVHTA
jgi:hypothetical protein